MRSGRLSGAMASHPELSARERLIVALDVSETAQALRLASALAESVSTFKVGKQLFTAAGPQAVRDLTSRGHRVFLDLKFHDIPHTVDAAVRAATALGVSMLTVHACGGSRMLRAAVRAAAEAPQPPLVLAVTVLTSMKDANVAEIGISGSLTEQVVRLAELAQRCGCGGIVTSAREARAVRQRLGPDLAIATPGIRPAGSEAADQERVVTPSEAIAAGVTYLVVGRPITASANPAGAARAILDEIASATTAISH